MGGKAKPANGAALPGGEMPGGRKRHTALNMFLYFFAVLFLFSLIALLTRNSAVLIDDRAELSNFDFSSHVGHIDAKCFDWYPASLYTPEDFAQGRVTQQPHVDDGKTGYYTYRLLLPLRQGEVYGLTGYSATHAQTLWVDGVLLSSVGVPGDSRETMTPKTNYFTVYFTAGAEPTELIIQRSSFVHANTGQLTPLYLGPQALITQRNSGELISISVLLGSILMAALFYFGLFMLFKERRHFLWFSIACFFIILRTITVDNKLIMFLLPDLDWELALKLEYLSTGLFSLFVVLFVNAIFEKRLNRRVNQVGFSVYILYSALVLLSPALVYTRFKAVFLLFVMSYTLIVMLQVVRLIVKNPAFRHLEQMLIVIGGAAYIAASLADIVLHQQGGQFDNTNVIKMGTLVFVFLNTLALALDFQRTEAELAAAQESERELDESNRLLARLNDMKTEFMANISHEMKTPLTVMSANAQLSKALVKAGADEAEISQSLDVVSDEAGRLARMVSEVLDLSIMQENRGGFVPVDLRALLEKTAEVYRTLLAQRGNTLTLHIRGNLRPVCGDADMLVQVVVNILANANTYTQNGKVAIAAAEDGGTVAVEIRDTGSGISPEILPHVFERHRTGGESGAGLGLPICSAIIKRHGGRIEIHSEVGTGTAVRFTLPVCGEGENDGQ
ncbi:sensor histidine kinase [Ruminococcaceae bacterium OttesenSCG-928-I18]|nr:sensor histidine kinase [Ruminococcaceae bacterium OttesenSCG-928-I18]